MKRIILGVVFMASLLVLFPAGIRAGEVDILIDKLVNKGVLTRSEADGILEEAKKQVKADMAKGKSDLSPTWAQTTKLKGDFRLRYQYEQRKGAETRNRGRIRYRLGIESKPIDTIKLEAGLASGGKDPRSTNQTFENTFETSDIRLDYASAEYAPWKEVKLIGGIFKNRNYLWRPSDLLWDTDINFHGGAAHLEKSLGGDTNSWFNIGALVLDESSSDTSDPFMFYLQPGLTWKNEGLDAKLALTYYGIDLRKHTLDFSSKTNTLDNNGKLLYKYDSISPAVEIGIKEPFGPLLERVALFGEYVNALDPSSNNNGWLVGVKFGNKKVAKKGEWQGKYMYAELEKDSWIDAFPDSDRYGGGTDMKSHEMILNYALMDNVVLGLDYYKSERILAAKRPESMFQLDINYKF